MQVRAIIGAAIAVRARTRQEPHVEIMIPLVDYERELELMRSSSSARPTRAVRDAGAEPVRFTVGTMIELPRACLVADRIATMPTSSASAPTTSPRPRWGSPATTSRASSLRDYLETQDRRPQPVRDDRRAGRGRARARWRWRRGAPTNREITLGVCGEHGGDPDSIDFFARVGLDYVSCSPYRVPIARVAAAQAAIRQRPLKPRPRVAVVAEYYPRPSDPAWGIWAHRQAQRSASRHRSAVLALERPLPPLRATASAADLALLRDVGAAASCGRRATRRSTACPCATCVSCRRRGR